MAKVKYITRISKVEEISEQDRAWMEEVHSRYKFRANDYYLSLIDWNDPDDPIRRIVIPDIGELEEWGELDASNERAVTPVQGLEHKYGDTALLLISEVCGAYCRFCFRKRLFIDENDEVPHDTAPQLDYIRKHKEITNVLLTGGDPFIFSTHKLETVISQLREIEHVHIIRIGTKMLAFDPFRFIDDPSLLEMLTRYTTPMKRIYIMAHYNHPRELTPESIQAVDLLLKAGCIVCNQSPIIRGVNDNIDTLAELMRKLSFYGIVPYYFFQCRPTAGNKPFDLPIVKAWTVFDRARRMVSGLAARARFVMSHASGKIEVLAVDREHIYLRYHRAMNPLNEGRFMIMRRDDEAYWFDDLVEEESHVHGEEEVAISELDDIVFDEEVGEEVHPR